MGVGQEGAVDERAEFGAFVRAVSRRAQQSAWLLTGDWAVAEDLVQTALVQVWRRWDTIRVADAREAYLRKVVVTTFLGWRRRRWVGEVAFGWLPEGARTDASLDATESRQVLLAALRELPAHQRAVLVLRYFDDLPEAATAEALGCSVGTVKSQTSRALRRLRAEPDVRSLVTEVVPDG